MTSPLNQEEHSLLHQVAVDVAVLKAKMNGITWGLTAIGVMCVGLVGNVIYRMAT